MQVRLKRVSGALTGRRGWRRTRRSPGEWFRHHTQASGASLRSSPGHPRIILAAALPFCLFFLVFVLRPVTGRAENESAPASLAQPTGGDASGTKTVQPTKGASAGAVNLTSSAAASSHIEGAQVGGRWREGSRLVDQLGFFKLTGDRITFISTDGKLRLDGLENLASERVARAIGDSPDQLEWSVSGVITEYRGTNYLLVTQSMLRTKSTGTRRAP